MSHYHEDVELVEVGSDNAMKNNWKSSFGFSHHKIEILFLRKYLLFQQRSDDNPSNELKYIISIQKHDAISVIKCYLTISLVFL